MELYFFSACIFINLIEQTFYYYLFALIFLGIGWNFLNIASTSLLVISYKKEEKFKVQGFNDFTVFTIQASASMLAGYFIYISTWQIMNLLCIPLLIIIIIITRLADTKKI